MGTQEAKKQGDEIAIHTVGMGSGGDTSSTSGSARAVVADTFGKSAKHEKFDPGKTDTSNMDKVCANG